MKPRPFDLHVDARESRIALRPALPCGPSSVRPVELLGLPVGQARLDLRSGAGGRLDVRIDEPGWSLGGTGSSPLSVKSWQMVFAPRPGRSAGSPNDSGSLRPGRGRK